MVDLKGLKFSKMHGIGNDFPIIDESKGEVIDEYWKLTLTKLFNDIKEADTLVNVSYEVE